MIDEYIDNDFETIKQSVENGEGTYLYHCTDERCLKGLLTNGPDRDWTGKNSNTYGSGFYTTFKLTSSEQNSQGHTYGGYIVKFLLIGGFNGFLIFDPEMAREVYGEWNIQKQIEMLCPPEVIEKLRMTENRYNGISVWDYMGIDENELATCRKTGGPQTGPLAKAFFDALKGEMLKPNEMTEYQRKVYAHQFKETLLRQTKVKGYIFQGNNDGYVCFVRDFKSILPVGYRDLNGNWHNALKEESFNNIANSSDAGFSFGGKYPETNPNEKAICGFLVVKKDGKYNYVNIKTGEELLPVWADSAYAFIESEGEAHFVIGGQEFTTNGKFFSDEDGFSYDKNEFIDELNNNGLINEDKTIFQQIINELFRK